MANARENPYVGPHAFRTEDRKKFAGRSRETLALYRLLIADRIVLLYSPSGAGKSSLVNAGLFPRMSQKGFIMFPVVRVNLSLPEELAAMAGANRYVMSMIQTLGGVKTGTSNEQLAVLTIHDYLTQRLRPANASGSDGEKIVEGEEIVDDEETIEPKSFLIFDQFEEILTVAPNDHEGKQEFFTQLGEALEVSRRWALFVVREDYVAALDPYRRFLPTRLANTYRLDLLDHESALEAVRKPAQLMKVSYTDEAAEHLINELRRVRIQRPDGSWEPEPQVGRYVEPVQLQVVCYRLWDKIGMAERVTEWDEIEKAATITDKEISDFGKFDEALAGYYADNVAETATAEEVNIPEKDIRTWFDTALITPNNIRSQVMWETPNSGGLDNKAILYLEKTHLIRRESRRGIMWLELAHDRLIKPVRDNNKEWFDKNLSTLQRHALLWAAEGEPDRLLLRDSELTQAEEWAKDQTLSQNEQSFLEACKDLRGRVEAEESRKEAEALAETNKRLRTKNRIAFSLALAAAVLTVVALFAWIRADMYAKDLEQYTEKLRRSEVAAQRTAKDADKHAKQAEENAQKAVFERGRAENASLFSNASQLAAQSMLFADSDPQLAILLALEALKMTERELKPPLPVAEEALRTALGSQSSLLLSGHTGQIQSVAISNDEQWLATADNKGDIRIWDLLAQNLLDSEFSLPILEEHSITNVMFSSDSNYLVASGDDGHILIFRLPEETGQEVFWTDMPLNPNYNEAVSVIAFSPDGAWFAAGGSNGTINLFSFNSFLATGNIEPIRVASSGILNITALKFSPDSSKLAAGSRDYLARLWSIDTPHNTPVLLQTQGPISALDFSPDGAYVAIGAEEIIYVWNVKAPSNPPDTYQNTTSRIAVLAYAPNESSVADGSNQHQLFVGHGDGSMIVWRGSGNTLNIPSTDDIIRVSDSEITHMSFSPDGHWLLTGSKDRLARLFDLSQINSPPRILGLFDDPITAAVISPKGTWISVSSDSPEAHLWNLKVGLDTVEPLSLDGGPFAFNQAGTILITGPQDDQLPPLLSWAFGDLDKLKRIFSEIKSADSNQVPMSSLAISQDDHWLAGCDMGGNVHIKDMNDSNARLSVLKDGPNDKNESCWRVEFSADGRYLVALENGEAKGVIKVWDLSKTDFARTDPQIIDPPHPGYLTALAFSLDGKWMATGNDGGDDGKGIALLWDMTKLSGGKPAFTIPNHSGWVNTLAFSPDGQWLVTGDDNGDIRLQNLRDREKAPIPVSAHESWVTAVTFSPDGQYLASASADGTIRLWLVLKNRLDENAFAFRGHEGPVWDLVFSPDQNWLASASSDNTVRLWDLSTRSRDAVVLKGYEDIVAQVDFTADGRWLITGSRDGTTRLWHMGLDRLQELACQMAGRNLTEREWVQFINNGAGASRNVQHAKTCPQYDLVSDPELAEVVVPLAGEDNLSSPETCSTRTDVPPVQLTFTNNSNSVVNVYWVNYNCELIFYGTLAPDDSYEQKTFATYPWRFVDSETGEVLKEFVAGTTDEEITIP